jgi:SAM-dependent methyltransferase
MTKPRCRHCRSEISQVVLDLGVHPPSNAYLSRAQLGEPEKAFPLRILLCSSCFLVQTEDFVGAQDLFTDHYAYLSSTSNSWLKHAETYAGAIARRLGLGPQSFVIEVGSNDGYLLQYFLRLGVPCLGIEPTQSAATLAEERGISVLKEFFGLRTALACAEEGYKADLLIGNNVFAHVPDINDFTQGIASILKPHGVVTLEFPHLMRLIEFNQFDTVYHEHYSYLSLLASIAILRNSGLRVFDVEELPTHGGSLRLFACLELAKHELQPSVSQLLEEERRRGLHTAEAYLKIQHRAEGARDHFRAFLLKARDEGRNVLAYGAAAKGNTLLNFAQVTTDLIPYVCDAAPSKQGLYMPGSRLPILHPDVLSMKQMDYLLVLPWNILPEIRRQLSFLERRGTRFVTAIPELSIQ